MRKCLVLLSFECICVLLKKYLPEIVLTVIDPLFQLMRMCLPFVTLSMRAFLLRVLIFSVVFTVK